MAPNRSLDEFLGEDGDADDAPAGPDGGDDDGTDADAGEGGGPDGGNGADRPTGPAGDRDDGESGDGDDPDRDPAVPTAEWTPDPADCDRCGVATDRRWRGEDGAMVCPDCKDWSATPD